MRKIIQNKLSFLINDINEQVIVITTKKRVQNEILIELQKSIESFKAIYQLCKSLSIPISKNLYEEIRNINELSRGLKNVHIQEKLLIDTELFINTSFKKLRSVLVKKKQNYINKFNETTFIKLKAPSIAKKIKIITIEELIDEKLYAAYQLNDLYEQGKVVRTAMYWNELLLSQNLDNEIFQEKRLVLKEKVTLFEEWYDYQNFIECIKDNDLTSNKYLNLIKIIECKNLIMVGK